MLSSGAIEHRLPFKLGSPLKNGLLSDTVNTDMNNEEVRTLFVSGLPMDVRLRELYLLFRCYEGYEGSFLKLISSKPGKPPQPIAFVSFTSRALAERALEELQGVRFDPASSQTLRLEFARTNSRVSPKQQQTQVQQQQSHVSQVQPPVVVPPQSNQPVYFQTYPTGMHKEAIAMAAQVQAAANHHSHQSLFGLAPDNSGWSHRMLPVNYQSLSHVSTPSPTLSPAPSTPHLSVLHSILSDSDSSVYNSPSHTPTQALDSASYYSQVPSASSPLPVDYPPEYPLPCSTLFVGNLESQTTEEEIVDLFGGFEGFVKAKLQVLSRGGRPVAFVEFKDIDCADNAMNTLQGHPLSNNRMSRIRIEYARQKMGESHVKSPQDDGSEEAAIQSITTSAASLNLAHSSPNSNADTPVLPSSLPTDSVSPTVVTAGVTDGIQQVPASFHLDLQHGGQSPISIPSLRPSDQYIQHASMSLPTFPVQQGMDPSQHSFSLPRQSPVQSISSLVTQNLSASGVGVPQRVDYGSLAPQNNRLMYNPQAYAGISRYPPQGAMLPPGAIGINPQGQVFLNGYVQGMPQSWPYTAKHGFQQQPM